MTKVFLIHGFEGVHFGIIFECKRHCPYSLLRCFSSTIYSSTSFLIISEPLINLPNRSCTAKI